MAEIFYSKDELGELLTEAFIDGYEHGQKDRTEMIMLKIKNYISANDDVPENLLEIFEKIIGGNI